MPKSCPPRATWALLGQAQVLPTLLRLPAFLLGHARLGLPNHVLGHAPVVPSPINCLSMPNRARPSRTVCKPKYLGCTWACPHSAKPAWARVWQAQVSASPARVQPMQNVNWYCMSKNRSHTFFAELVKSRVWCYLFAICSLTLFSNAFPNIQHFSTKISM